METENLVFDECSEREVIEEVGEVFPDIGIAIFPQTFIVEPVHLGDLTGFVVSTEDSDTLGIANFETHQKRDCFNGVVATVDIITLRRSKHQTNGIDRRPYPTSRPDLPMNR